MHERRYAGIIQVYCIYFIQDCRSTIYLLRLSKPILNVGISVIKTSIYSQFNYYM